MSIHLEIPDHIAQAMRLPLAEQKQQLLIELAVALYARGILSFGKARELAGRERKPWGWNRSACWVFCYEPKLTVR